MVKLKAQILSMSRKKIFLLISTVFMAVALWALPSAGSAWMSWSGADPVIELSNGHTLAIMVEVPTENGCDLTGITVHVQLPEGVSADSIEESSDDLGCGVVNSTTTVSNVARPGGPRVDHAVVTVITHSESSHPIRLLASVDGGKFKQISWGKSNAEVKGGVVIK